MDCPNCGKEMLYKDEGYHGFALGEWDLDYPYWHPHDVYRCRACKIKKDGDEWHIPACYALPTARQLRTVEFINRQLGMDFDPVLKRQCWRFIHDHLHDASQLASVAFSEWCEDNADWLPEHF